MGKITSRMAYERTKSRNLDQAASKTDNRLFKARFSQVTHVLPTNTHRKRGITLPGKYYGDKPLDSPE